MHTPKLVLVLMIAALVTACGDKPNPVGLNLPAAPTVAVLVISGADYVLTGSTTAYTATVTLSDGSTRTVTPSWSSSAADVATVDDAGRLDSRGHGSTTLTAAHAGRSASKTVQVVNNYGGSWIGSYVINGCDAPPGVCAGLEYDSFSFPIHLHVSQTGDRQDEISAILVLPSRDIRANIGGTVTSDGTLNIAGSSPLTDRQDRTWAAFHVGAWDTNLRSHDVMTGRWAQRLSVLQPRYDEYQENELIEMTKIWPPATPVSAHPPI